MRLVVADTRPYFLSFVHRPNRAAAPFIHNRLHSRSRTQGVAPSCGAARASVALTKGFAVTGTLGILRLAAQVGLIDLADTVAKLKRTNFPLPAGDD